MKKIITLAAIFMSLGLFAQTDFGIKAGLNYGDNGDIEFRDISSAGEDVYHEQGDTNIGYHFGVFLRSYFTEKLYLRPEVIYTHTKSTYESRTFKADYRINKLDLPILLGYKIIGPIHIFAGPSLQYIVENDLDDLEMGEVENEFTIGAQFGAGIEIGSVGIDARYERGFTKNEAEVLDLENTFGVQRIDTRPSQFILSVSLDF